MSNDNPYTGGISLLSDLLLRQCREILNEMVDYRPTFINWSRKCGEKAYERAWLCELLESSEDLIDDLDKFLQVLDEREKEDDMANEDLIERARQATVGWNVNGRLIRDLRDALEEAQRSRDDWKDQAQQKMKDVIFWQDMADARPTREQVREELWRMFQSGRCHPDDHTDTVCNVQLEGAMKRLGFKEHPEDPKS